jgi:hypothetical protein
MNQKDKDKILTRINAQDLQERNDMLYFLLGYCDQRPDEFWQGMAAFLHIDIK